MISGGVKGGVGGGGGGGVEGCWTVGAGEGWRLGGGGQVSVGSFLSASGSHLSPLAINHDVQLGQGTREGAPLTGLLLQSLHTEGPPLPRVV